jgi:NAD+ synthase
MSTRACPPELTIDSRATGTFISRFIAHEVRRSGFEKVVLGLSGGVDSALVAALAAHALGPENVHAYMLPYRASSKDSRADAKAVAQLCGIRTETVDITKMADSYIGRARMDRIRKGNVLARLRMVVLFDQAKARRALVAGTSNKTEMFLGYSTWYGDSAASFQPIGDLYKSQVWQLAAWLRLPKRVIEKDPTADLWPGQTDEEEIGMRYVDVDRMLFYLLDRATRPSELVRNGYSRERVEALVRTIRATQFKRQMPSVAKLSTRTIGTDFLLSRDFDPDSGW